MKKIRKIKNLEKRRVIIMTNREVYENMCDELEQYHAIGTVKECREAREKQTPNKPKDGLYGHGYFACGSCKNPLDGDES